MASPNAEDSYEGDVGKQRRRMPNVRKGITHKVSIDDISLGPQKGYITLNTYEDGTLGEIFINGFAKEGSTVDGFIQWATVEFSIALQYGAEVAMMCRKLGHMKFDPRGKTDNPEIPFCHSIPAYVAELIAIHFGTPSLIDHMIKIREQLTAT